MKVILQEKMGKLGNVGDQVKVKPGFGRNYLLPKGKAVMATEENIADFESRRAELEKAAAATLKAAQDHAKKFESLVLKFEEQAGDEGKLFGSIGPRDIAQASTEAGVELNKSQVTMPEGPIHYVGEFEVGIHLHSEVSTTVKVEVSAAKSE